MKKTTKRPDTDQGTPEPGQIRATEIVKWVLKNRDRYPLDYHHEAVFYDLPDSVAFHVIHWCSFTKSGLARFMETNPAQISRWLEYGMRGIQEDGRIWAEQAIEWQERWEKESHVHERGRT